MAVAGEKQAERLVGVQNGTQGGRMECKQTQTSGLLKQFPEGLRGKIVEFMVKRENQGYKGTKQVISRLKYLVKRGANLYDPDSVASVIKTICKKDTSRRVYCDVYDAFLRFLGGTWEKPKYEGDSEIPYIPTETELDQLIAALRGKASIFCQVAKDTGASRSEILWLRWRDIYLERRQVVINKTTKGHAPRVIPVSQKCIDMINRLPHNDERVFGGFNIDCAYYPQRKRIAYRLSNPRLLQIGLHTFRHWKGTIEYHKDHDLVRIQRLLGHKNIKNTMIYIDYEKIAYGTFDDQFITRMTYNAEEACKLIEVGFDYVTGEYNDGGKIFRKRK